MVIAYQPSGTLLETLLLPHPVVVVVVVVVVVHLAEVVSVQLCFVLLLYTLGPFLTELNSIVSNVTVHYIVLRLAPISAEGLLDCHTLN